MVGVTDYDDAGKADRKDVVTAYGRGEPLPPPTGMPSDLWTDSQREGAEMRHARLHSQSAGNSINDTGEGGATIAAAAIVLGTPIGWSFLTFLASLVVGLFQAVGSTSISEVSGRPIYLVVAIAVAALALGIGLHKFRDIHKKRWAAILQVIAAVAGVSAAFITAQGILIQIVVLATGVVTVANGFDKYSKAN